MVSTDPEKVPTAEALKIQDARKARQYRLHKTRLVYRSIALVCEFLALCMTISVAVNVEWSIGPFRPIHST
jgi:hypothetical protein